jgi:colanic acid biosynthesis glycosyl transferase WcaI
MSSDKVLIVTQLYPPESGGNASRISDMSENLEKLGYGVSILSPPPTFPFGSFKRSRKLWDKKNIRGVDVVNVWTWQPSSEDPGFVSRMAYYLVYAAHAALWSLLNVRQYGVVITSAPPLFLNLAGLMPGLIFKKPWIVDVRDLWIDASVSLGFIKENSAMEKLSRLFERLCYARCDLICVTTEETKKKILARYAGIPPEKIAIVPNGVDLTRFRPCAVRKSGRLIYTGNIGYAQDLEKVVLAMDIVRHTHDAQLLIVGKGDLKDRLAKLVDERQLGKCVTFMDLVPREEVPKLISESYVGLAPLKSLESLEYAIPSKVYEYMACGIPFIGCSKGEIVNIADRSKSGFIVANDVGSIARAICELLDDPARVAEMGQNGQEYVRQYCDRKVIARNFYSLVAQAMVKHVGGARTSATAQDN